MSLKKDDSVGIFVVEDDVEDDVEVNCDSVGDFIGEGVDGMPFVENIETPSVGTFFNWQAAVKVCPGYSMLMYVITNVFNVVL